MNAPLSSAQLLIAENRQSQSPFLDLGNCGLTSLPTELAELVWLEDLNLGSVYWNEERKLFINTPNNGPANQLGSETFEVLAALERLHKLSARNCRLSSNISRIAEHKQLRSLTLGENHLSDIAPLGDMTALTTLSLFENEISDIAPLRSLKDLRMLSLNYNAVEDIGPLRGLTNLTELHLAGNHISDIGSLTGLTRLERINLSFNSVRFIAPLLALPQLQAVQLNRNPIEDCPLELAYSGDVERMRAYFSTMSRSAPAPEPYESAGPAAEKEAKAYREVKLILVGNATSGKTTLSKLLRGIPTRKQEETTHGIQVSEWLIEQSELRELFPDDDKVLPMRVNIWDFGGQEYYHGTHQIFLDSNAVYLLLWDAEHNSNGEMSTEIVTQGAQRTVPVEHFHYRYWLDNIRLYASGATTGDPPPIMLVQNKADLLPGGRGEWIDAALMNRFAVSNVSVISARLARSAARKDRRYRNLFEVFREDLIRLLYNKALGNVQLDQLPGLWTRVREYLQELRTGAAGPDNPFAPALQQRAWIPIDAFRSACRAVQADLSDEEIETLAFYLDRIGAVVWLQEQYEHVYIDPGALTDKMYKVLTGSVREKQGHFSTEDIRSVLKKETDMLLRLMEYWEIIFPGEQNGTWVAPQYLGEAHPMADLFDIALAGLQDDYFLFEMPLFYYRKAMRRLILRYGAKKGIRKKTYWRSGLLCVTDLYNTRLFIKGLHEPGKDTARLMFCVEKNRPDTELWRQTLLVDFLKMLLRPGVRRRAPEAAWAHNLAALRAEAEKLDEVHIALSTPDSAFVSLPTLIGAAQRQVSAILTDKGKLLRLREFSSLLAGLQMSPPAPTVFISYSHDDLDARKRLETHLAPLRRRTDTMVWTDSEIKPGQQWEEEIRRYLNSADIVVLLVSANFISSGFIWEKELLPALERHRKGECRVLPVLISPCDFEGLPFTDIQMLPQRPDTNRLYPVRLWADQDEGYVAVVQGIKKAMAELAV